MTPTPTEALIRRDRAVTAAGLIVICALSWLYIFAGAGVGMDAASWGADYWLLMIAMWWVMMIAMMIPSAAPMILLYGLVYRQGQERGQIKGSVVPTAVFLAGYGIAWLGFSVGAASLQRALEAAGLMHAMSMQASGATLSGGFLILAGFYQVSPLKTACLRQCRSPADFLSRHWRPGRLGALRMGVEHGLYCVGCCWVLMALLFVGGIMNLVWIAGLAVLVLVEKLSSRGEWVAYGAGAALIGAGIYVLIAL